MLAELLLLSSFATANGHIASCAISKSSILSLSSSGVPQVSNLAFIEVECTVPARPVPTQRGEFRRGLGIATTVYQVDANGVSEEVPSRAEPRGGGQQGSEESVSFYLYLPLDPADRRTEAKRWVSHIQEIIRKDPDPLRKQGTEANLHEMSSPQSIDKLSDMVSQHRAGHFHAECHVLDGDHVVGTDTVDFEVLFKGRFSDRPGPPGYWQISHPNGIHSP